MTLNKRLDLIEPMLYDMNFRTGRGSGGELNFWIFDYLSSDEMAIRAHVDSLITRINGKKDEDLRPGDLRIRHFDLYALMLNVLREKNYLDRVIDMEKVKGSEAIIKPLKSTLRLTESSDLIIHEIVKDLVPVQDVIFLTGVGKAWPIIRSHTILNNLHSRVENNPLLMFFPGEYTHELKLFEEITDDNYYRAKKLV